MSSKPVKREKNILTNDFLSNIVTTVNVSTPQIRVLIKREVSSWSWMKGKKRY